MPSFKYLGPNSTLHEEESARPLTTEQVYDDLPEDHPIVENLKAHKLLVPVPEEPFKAVKKGKAKLAVVDDGSTKENEE